MRYITDFADPAVVLALLPAVAVAVLAGGWWRGGIAWLVAGSGALGCVLLLKLGLSTAGWGATLSLRSPSGHTASAVFVAGGIGLLLGLRRSGWLALAIAAWVLIGVSRVALAFHTPAESVAGGVVGLAGLLVMARMAGPAPAGHRRWALAGVVLAVLAGLHGTHLAVEQTIQQAGRALAHRAAR